MKDEKIDSSHFMLFILMSKDLTVIEQKEVVFHDDLITAVRVEDGTIYVPVRPICNLLGVAWNAQFERIKRDAVLSEVITVVRVTRTTAGATKHQTNQLSALPLDYLNGWLFGINANRVKASVRAGLIRYQKECYRVLADAFGRNMVTAKPDDMLMTSDSPAALAYRNALEVANLARQQFYLEQRIESAESRLSETISRVDAIEAELGNDARFITVSQTAELSDAVRAIGLVFSKTTGANEYGKVYGELHRRFGINSYKRLPAAKYDDAMNWLRGWYEDLTDDNVVPF